MGGVVWTGIEKGRGKEGCAIMVSPRVWKGIDVRGWIGSRIVWMTGKIGMVKCAWVCVYAPVNEKGMKGKMKLEKFWEDLGELLKKFENVRRVFLLGDVNARVGNTEIGVVVGKYGVDGVNENGQYLVDICAERVLFLSNTSFQHKVIHRYTWARGNDRSLIDYRAVDNRLRREVEDAKVVREMFSGSDHFAVVAQVRMRERWEFKGNGKKVGESRELASESLRNSEDSQRYGRKVEELLGRARVGMEDNAYVSEVFETFNTVVPKLFLIEYHLKVPYHRCVPPGSRKTHLFVIRTHK